MKTTKILILGILVIGILLESVSALERVDISVSPEPSSLVLGRSVVFNVKVTNIGTETLPKGTKLSFRLYNDGNERIRHIYPSIGGIEPGESRTFSTRTYKFTQQGHYSLVGQVLYKKYLYHINSDTSYEFVEEFRVLSDRTDVNVATLMFQRVNVAIYPDTGTINAGDTITFNAEVTNAGTTNLMAGTRLVLRLYRQNKNGQFARVRYISKYLYYLEPGKSKNIPAKSYKFKEPGTYKFVVEVYAQGGVMESLGNFIYSGGLHKRYPYYVNSDSSFAWVKEFEIQ